MSKTLTNYVKEMIARIKGDDAEAIAIKNQRKAISAFKTELALKQNKVLSLEDTVEEANENLNNALLNHGKPITDRADYMDAVLDAKNNLLDAEEDLEAIHEEIEFLEKQLEYVSK